MDNELIDIVKIAGSSLECEDKTIRNSIASNSQAYGGQHGGILRINNERYYQFVVARALIGSYPKPIDLEKNNYDLVVLGENQSRYEVVVEMKRWMSSTGNSEISGIKVDIDKHLSSAKSNKALMLIYSANPRKVSIQENIFYLCDKLEITFDKSRWSWYEFNTVSTSGEDTVFWVSGYEVKNA